MSRSSACQLRGHITYASSGGRTGEDVEDDFLGQAIHIVAGCRWECDVQPQQWPAM